MERRRHLLLLAAVVVIIILIAELTRLKKNNRNRRKRIGLPRTYSLIDKRERQVAYMKDLVGSHDVDCFNNLRLNKSAFKKLSNRLKNDGGLRDSKYGTVEEKTAIFLRILAHHTKNRVAKFVHKKSGCTISKYFHQTLRALIRLHPLLFVHPEPVTDSCTKDRWKDFQGCLGALDGTYIPVNVAVDDQTRYRTRKGQISTNVLGVCNTEGKFVYLLPGWEGSAADSRVLRDALTRPNGLKVPQGSYYLCDNGYSNAEGFLTPYRGTRYHLNEWETGTRMPVNAQEFFNMKHSRARNVIERTFGILKKRWAILRSPAYYPIKTQNRIIIACALLHNFIKDEMPGDPLEMEDVEVNENEVEIEYIHSIEPSEHWSGKRDAMAESMYDDWRMGS